jgi:hypothetical protein
MITFQFDENLDAEEFARACESEGMADVWRFPRQHRGEPDEAVIPYFMGRRKTVLTCDLGFAEEHLAYIPNANPGIVIIGLSADYPGTMNPVVARKIVGLFKGRFPRWHHTPCTNSMLKITDADARVWYVRDRLLRPDGGVYISYSETNWQSKLIKTLKQNSKRFKIR